MSVDLEIWSVARPDHDSFALPGLVRAGSGWVFSARRWQVAIDESVEIDEDEIPEPVAPHLVGIRFLTRMYLEPGHAPATALRKMHQLARAIAKSCEGIVWDPAGATVLGRPAGASRNLPATTSERRRLDLVTLSWWFSSGPLTTPEGMLELIRYFERNIPEFAPRRYGDCEPPRFRFDSADPKPFQDFAFGPDSRPLLLVWKAHRLFSVSYWPTDGPAWRWFQDKPEGFRVPHLELSCPAELLDDPAWSLTLRRLWKWVTALAEPIYGDVPILRGAWVGRGALFYIAGEKRDSHPVRAYWRGLPNTLGLATVVGEPYVSHWPSLQNRIEKGSAYAMCSLDDWRIRGDTVTVLGTPPKELCQPDDPEPWKQRIFTERADFWPFPLPSKDTRR